MANPQEPAQDPAKPLRSTPFPARTPYGQEEIEEVTDALRSQNLFSFGGTKVKALEHRFAPPTAWDAGGYEVALGLWSKVGREACGILLDAVESLASSILS